MSVSESIKRAHWGQLEEEKLDHVTTKDVTKGDKSMVAWNSFDVPPLYQPCAIHKLPKRELSEDKQVWVKAPLDSKDQNYVFQSIELQNYKMRMRYMLSAAHSHQNDTSPALPSPPIPPKRFCSKEGRLLTHSQPTFMSSEYASISDKKAFASKHLKCPIELDPLSTRQLMSRAIAGIAAHAMFELATESTLNTLTDITAQFSLKLCKSLKTYLEYRSSDEDVVSGFSHILKQCTNSDVISLQEYWIVRVKNIALKQEKENTTLLEEYNALKESSSKVTIKEEKL